MLRLISEEEEEGVGSQRGVQMMLGRKGWLSFVWPCRARHPAQVGRG